MQTFFPSVPGGWVEKYSIGGNTAFEITGTSTPPTMGTRTQDLRVWRNGSGSSGLGLFQYRYIQTVAGTAGSGGAYIFSVPEGVDWDSTNRQLVGTSLTIASSAYAQTAVPMSNGMAANGISSAWVQVHAYQTVAQSGTVAYFTLSTYANSIVSPTHYQLSIASTTFNFWFVAPMLWDTTYAGGRWA